MHHKTAVISSLVFTVIFLCASRSFSQVDSAGKKAQVILINGNRISGNILFNNQDPWITVSPSEKMNIKVPVNIIKSITFNPYSVNKSERENRLKYFNDTSFGIGLGRSSGYSNTVAAISAEIINGLSYRNLIQAGVGIGYDVYELVSAMPLFISLSGRILRGNITPFYFIQGGFSSAWENENIYQEYSGVKGKAMYAFGFGYRVYGGERIYIAFSAGYRAQAVTMIAENSNSIRSEDRNFKRFVLRVHLGF